MRFRSRTAAGAVVVRLRFDLDPPSRLVAMARKAQEYDLVALGGGVGGLVATAGAAYLGLKPAVVEKAKLGGDCLWTGCVPSKALIASARLARSMETAATLGLGYGGGKPEFRTVMERVRAARAIVADHDDPERFRRMGADVHFGAARFLSPSVVEVEGVGRLRSKRFVVATGAAPHAPPIPGLADAGHWTYETVFEHDDLPETIAILGGGPVGVEFAQAFARLGSRVVVLEAARAILTKEDEDAALFMNALLETEGVAVRVGVAVRSVAVERGAKALELATGERIRVDEILVATGRRPHTEGLNLASGGIETDATGAVKVDRRLRTTSERAWAVGDAAGAPQFTHVAERMAKVALRNATLPLKATIQYEDVPRVTYTDPEIAHFGLGEKDARAVGASVYRYELDDLDRAVVDASAIGFVKVSADRRGRILGATVVARGAGDLIFPLALAKRHGISLAKLADADFPYPTMVEGVKRAAAMHLRGRLDSFAGKALKRVVRWLK